MEDSLAGWAEGTGTDGFNLSSAVLDGGFRDFTDLVVPVLQHRGLYKAEYGEDTLRQKLFAKGDRSQAPHPAALRRRRSAKTGSPTSLPE